MSVQNQSPWTEEQEGVIDAIRRDMQHMKHLHEAALEEQKQVLLQCLFEIRCLRESAVKLQEIKKRLTTPSSDSLSTVPSSGSDSEITLNESNQLCTSDTIQPPTKKQKVTPKANCHEAASYGQELPLKLPEGAAIPCTNMLRSVDAVSHKIRSHRVYVYASLPDYTSIRLLKLVSGSIFSPLQCELVVSRTIADQSYHTLSYAWGENTKTHYVIIEDKRLPVSANLDRALRSVRRTEQDLYLWVDAICINQDDSIEKENQICMMLQIYQSAQRVVVYLGEQYAHSELLPEFFDTTIRALRVFNSLDGDEKIIDHEDLHRSMGTLREIGESASENPMWRAARAFYSRPWIMRAWVVQEVLVASEVVFLCGGWELPGSVIYGSAIASMSYPQLCPFGDISLDEEAKGEAKGLVQLFRMAVPPSVGRSDFLDLLYLGHGCKATDRRDHVFALLGMALEASEPSLRPSYREGWQETYLRYTEYFVREGHGLRVLYRSSADSASAYKQRCEIPSWVPDFSFEGELLWFANDHNDVHGNTIAGGRDNFAPRINMNIRILTIQAMKVCSIQSLGGGQAQQPYGDHYAQVLQWRTELEELWPSTQSPSTEEMPNTICRVMLCQQEPPDLETYQSMIWSADSSAFDTNDGKILFRELYRNCRPRRRCVTSTGFLGQVPSLAHEGDLIVIPMGSAVPFILRPHQTRYQLIGQAYIHGVMMGEVLQSSHFAKEEIELI